MTGIPEFDLSTQLDNGQAVVSIRGELDVETAPELKQVLAGLIDGGPGHITIDLAGVEFIDSSGIHALVTSLKRAQEHDRKLELRSPGPSTYKVLEIVGLAEVFPIT
ncbi:MAG: STAS domain-containing protein [Actinomycetota bacterium]|nr:STAS domain-containing protein [Actinomycetota bacterium]